MNDALVIERGIVSPPFASNAIDRTLETGIDTTLNPLLRVGEEVSNSEKLVKSKVKRFVKRKLTNRGKRPPTDGWRLNDTKFNKLHAVYKFTVEGCCDTLGLNGHMKLPFYSE